MAKPLKVLVIEDSEEDTILLLRHLAKGGYDVRSRRVADPESLTTALTEEKWDIVFSDHNMPGFSSTAALSIVRARDADIPFVIVSGSIGEEVAVAAMKAGAQDYLIKGHFARLVAAVDREMKDAGERHARREAERSLLTQQEALRIARDVQQRLFPDRPPVMAGYDIAGASCPAEATGGDYFDFIRGVQDDTFLVIGDVSGHGLGSALLMADVRAYLRALLAEHGSLPDVLRRASQLLHEDLGSYRFITLLSARLRPAAHTLEFVNAGHPPGYVLGADGRIKAELTPCVPALGLDWEGRYPDSTEILLAPGDLVLLLTDGALEAAASGGEEFGLARVLDLVKAERHRPAGEIITALFDAVRAFSEESSLRDDLTAVIVKVSP